MSVGNNDPVRNMRMSDALRRTCKDTGVHSIFNRTAFDINETRYEKYPEKREELRNNLLVSSVQDGFKLTSIQREAVLNIVWPPSCSVKISKVVPDVNSHSSTRVIQEVSREYGSPESDIQRLSILDMATGTGKTITVLMGSIMFAIHRNDDMKLPPLKSESVSGCTEVTSRFNKNGSNRVCMVFCPRHLFSHWVRHAEIASKLSENMDNSWKVHVFKNIRASDISLGEKEIAVVICDISRFGTRKALEEGSYYSSLCFDECGESDSKTNATYQSMPRGVVYGRMIMCSADLSKWAISGGSSRNGSVMRSIFPTWGMKGFGRGNFPHFTDANCVFTIEGMHTVAILSIASVFGSEERERIVTESIAPLDTSTVYTASVGYVPTLLERLGNGSGADIGDVQGCKIFEDKYKINISNCKTFGDIQKKLRSTISSILPDISDRDTTNRLYELNRVSTQMEEILTEDCPVCLDTMRDASVIQPCMHFTCGTCISKIGHRCPICRGPVGGAVNFSTKRDLTIDSDTVTGTDSTKKCKPSLPVCGSAMGDLFFEEMCKECPIDPVPGGVAQALVKTLSSVSNAHERSGGGTFKAMLICPGTNVRGEDFEDMGFTMIPHRTSGTVKDPATLRKLERNLQNFKADDGRKKILLVRDEGDGERRSVGKAKTDSMTGLDIDGLDAVISVGGGNTAQRMGRLCRISRSRLPESKRNALYVELVKASGY